jgi:hypothetical protein
VILKIVEIKKEMIEGKILDEDYSPLFESKENYKEKYENLEKYEESLQKHMIYYLLSDHCLPSKDEINKNGIKILSFKETMESLEKTIVQEENFNPKNMFCQMNKSVISIESLYNIYIEQIRNEFSVFESNLTQGYIYSINPPRIFAQYIV